MIIFSGYLTLENRKWLKISVIWKNNRKSDKNEY